MAQKQQTRDIDVLHNHGKKKKIKERREIKEGTLL